MYSVQREEIATETELMEREFCAHNNLSSNKIRKVARYAINQKKRIILLPLKHNLLHMATSGITY